jgi:hypothetical protein
MGVIAVFKTHKNTSQNTHKNQTAPEEKQFSQCQINDPQIKVSCSKHPEKQLQQQGGQRRFLLVIATCAMVFRKSSVSIVALTYICVGANTPVIAIAVVGAIVGNGKGRDHYSVVFYGFACS